MSTGYKPITRALSASGTDSITNPELPYAEFHYVHVSGSGTVQFDFHVDNQTLPAETVTVAGGSGGVKVSRPDVTNIELTETTGTNAATGTTSGR